MDALCVVVADGARARFLTLEASTAPRAPRVLVERDGIDNPDLRERGTAVTGRPRTETNTNRQAGPMHPIGAQRERHRVELARRFAAEIAERAALIVAPWPAGTLMLVAEPRMLGMVREITAQAVKPGIRIKELAKDYCGLRPDEILNRLVDNGASD